MKKTLFAFAFALTLAVSAFAQSSGAAQYPVPSVNNVTNGSAPFGFGQPSNNTVAQTCGPQVDVVVNSHGIMFKACEQADGKVSLVRYGGGFEPSGMVSDIMRFADGRTVVMTDSSLIRSDLNTSQVFPAPRGATVLLGGRFDKVTTLDQRGQVFDTFLYPDASFYGTHRWDIMTFPGYCTQEFNGLTRPFLYCIDKWNGVISRAEINPFHTARPNFESVEWYKNQNLQQAHDFAGGLLVLTRTVYTCPDQGKPVPDSAVMCYYAGDCKRTESGHLLLVKDNGKSEPGVTAVPVELSTTYNASFVILGKYALVVETEFDAAAKWVGDYVSKVNLLTGQKSVWLSRTQFADLVPGGVDLTLSVKQAPVQ